MDMLTGMLLGGAVLGGAFLSSQANQQAAELQYQAQMQQAEAIRLGNEMADKRLQDLKIQQAEQASQYQDQLGPPSDYLQTVMATRPEDLTLAQQGRLQETRDQATAAVNKSSLRGSGGYLPAVLKSVETDAVGKMVAENQARKDAAASRLLSTYAPMTGAAQSREFQAGSGYAGLPSTAGQQYGGAIAGAGNAAAQGVVATAQPYSNALSQISAIAAGEEKEARARRYQKETEETLRERTI